MKISKILFSLLFLFAIVGAKAEINLNSTTSYCILNGYKGFTTNICLRDDVYAANSLFHYSFVEREAANSKQEFNFTPVSGDETGTQFYIRCAGTHYYLSAQTNIADNNFYYPSQFITKSQAKPWTLTDLKNGQFTISCVDDYGVTFYLHASDTTTTRASFTNIKLCKNTRFAWTVQEASTLDAIQAVKSTNNAEVSVEGSQIKVTGTKDYRIYTLSGLEVTSLKALAPGFYLVRLPEKTVKVNIE